MPSPLSAIRNRSNPQALALYRRGLTQGTALLHHDAASAWLAIWQDKHRALVLRLQLMDSTTVQLPAAEDLRNRLEAEATHAAEHVAAFAQLLGVNPRP